MPEALPPCFSPRPQGALSQGRRTTTLAKIHQRTKGTACQDGHFTREQFRFEPAENVYYCPEGKPLRLRGVLRTSQGYAYQARPTDCRKCPQKKLCTSAPSRKLFVHWHEPARQAVRALVGTPAYEHSRRARYKIEALFAELKQRMRLGRVRLRRLWNVGEQFLLAATAQNLKRLVRFLVQRPPMLRPQVS